MRLSPVAVFLLLSGLFIISDKAAYGEVDCLMCHSDLAKKKTVHAAVQMGCPSCHSAIDAADIPHKKTNKIAKGLTSEPPELCYGCHDKTMFSKKTIHPALAMGCTSCHNPHSTDTAKLLVSDPPDLCFNCHDRKNFEGKVIHPPVMGGMCTSCHNPHSQDAAKLLVSEPPSLCFTCHDQKKFKDNFTHAPVGEGMCTGCHAPHKSDNEKLLLSGLPELCFNCHDRAGFSKKNVHVPVAVGMCTSCHSPHASSTTAQLLKPVNELCLTCHTNAGFKSGLHVVRSFAGGGHPMKAKKDPKRPEREFSCAGCHNPHSSDWIKLFRYKASSNFELCVHCHEK